MNRRKHPFCKHGHPLEGDNIIWVGPKENKSRACRLCARSYYRVYGITPKEVDAMLEKQEYKCAVCGDEFPGEYIKRFHVDHDHKTDTVRGLLCQRCNTGIGQMRDSPQNLRNAANYLERGNF